MIIEDVLRAERFVSIGKCALTTRESNGVLLTIASFVSGVKPPKTIAIASHPAEALSYPSPLLKLFRIEKLSTTGDMLGELKYTIRADALLCSEIRRELVDGRQVRIYAAASHEAGRHGEIEAALPRPRVL